MRLGLKNSLPGICLNERVLGGVEVHQGTFLESGGPPKRGRKITVPCYMAKSGGLQKPVILLPQIGFGRKTDTFEIMTWVWGFLTFGMS